MSESTDNAPPSAPWRDALLIILLAPALIAGCYSARFLEFDDTVHYNHELALPEVPWSGTLKAVFGTYFPVTIWSYRVDRAMYESTPPAPWLQSKAAPGVRFNSLVLHVLAALFLWRALLWLKFGRWMSLFAAAVWTVHPMACESVCWISERKNVLAGLFGFASLWIYFGGVRRTLPRVAATFALFMLAMLSKPNAAGFLPIYVLFDLYFFLKQRGEGGSLTPNPSPESGQRDTRELALWLLPRVILFAICAGAILWLARLNMAHCETSTVALAGGSLWTVALTDVPILVEYIINSLVPASLSIFYYSPVMTSPASVLFLTRFALLMALFGGTVWISPNRWRTVFLWGWFVGALGPSLNLVPIPYLMQDRYAYFSLPALLMIAAETVAQFYLKVKGSSKSSAPQMEMPNVEPGARFKAGIVIGAALCFALMAALRSDLYRNDFLLFGDAVIKQPLSTYAQLHYALTIAGAADVNDYSGTGLPTDIRDARVAALEHLTLCAKSPDFDRQMDPRRVRIVAAVLTERLGLANEAYPLLKEELAHPQKPYNYALACQALSRIELSRGQPKAAMIWIESGIRALGNSLPSAELMFQKGICHEALQQLDEARVIFRAIPAGSLAYDRAQDRLKRLSAH